MAPSKRILGGLVAASKGGRVMLAVKLGLPSPDFKANPCIFGQKANRFSSIIPQWVQFSAKSRHYRSTFCRRRLFFHAHSRVDLRF